MYKVIIDFETRSKCDIKNHGAWIYSRHPSTEILCIGYIISKDNQILTTDVISDLENNTLLLLLKKNVDKVQLVAHNAFFEQCIYNNILFEKRGWPEIKSHQWKCTMAKSMAHALPRSLDAASEELCLSHKKDMTGHRIMLKMSRPKKPTSKDPSIWHEKKEDMESLKRYCLADVKATYELDKLVRDLSPIEQKIWELDQKINTRGLYVDTELAKKAIELIDKHLLPLNREISILTGGVITSPTQASALKKWCNDRLPEELALTTLSKDVLPKYVSDNGDKIPNDVKKVLNIRICTSKTSNAKFSAFLNHTDIDMRARGSLLYHGASTGRWAGVGIQPQNLPRGKSDINTDEIIDQLKLISCTTQIDSDHDALSVLSSCLRGCIASAPGKILICGDYASIEARVLMYEAKEDDAVEIFKNNGDIYCDMASDIYKRNITKKDKEERALGKTAILGLGYSMGADKFIGTCATNGIIISDELALQVVKAYRSKYFRVVKFWKDIENAAINAVKTGKCHDVNNIRYKKIGNFLYCRLPSGRLLSYFRPKIVISDGNFGKTEQLSYRGMDAKTKKFTNLLTYGGRLVENICQGIARDVMAHAMLNLEDKGYNVILTVHDEVVCEVDENSDTTLDEFLKIAATPPVWAPNCPLLAEGWIGKRYHK